MQCAMIVGYLVPHRCSNKALGACIKCGRPFCDEHMAIVESGLVCLACQKGIAQPVLVPAEGLAYTDSDLAVFSALSAEDTAGDTLSDLT